MWTGGFGASDDDGSGRSQPSKGVKHEKGVNVKRAHLRSLPFGMVDRWNGMV